MSQITIYMCTSHTKCRSTAHLTNMILEVTPSKWFRTFWTSIEPIHCRDPTKDGSLSPTSTRAFVETTPPIKGTLSQHHDCVITSFHSEPNRYLLDLPVVGNWSLRVALLLEPGTDGLKWSVSAAPAVVVNVVLHVVVVTVDASNQGHLQETYSCGLSKTARQPFQRFTRRYMDVCMYAQSNEPFLDPGRDV